MQTKTHMASASQESREMFTSSRNRNGLKTVNTQRVVRKTRTVTRGEQKTRWISFYTTTPSLSKKRSSDGHRSLPKDIQALELPTSLRVGGMACSSMPFCIVTDLIFSITVRVADVLPEKIWKMPSILPTKTSVLPVFWIRKMLIPHTLMRSR